MRNAVVVFFVLFLSGCSNLSQNISKAKSFAKCYVHKLPAPFWVCYQSTFSDIGKIKTKKNDRVNEEIAYSKAIQNLIMKLQAKTKELLQKLNIKNPKILDDVKSYVLVNAIEEKSWYDKKHNMLYVLVEIDKDDFRNFLQEELKIDKKIFRDIFDENF